MDLSVAGSRGHNMSESNFPETRGQGVNDELLISETSYYSLKLNRSLICDLNTTSHIFFTTNSRKDENL